MPARRFRIAILTTLILLAATGVSTAQPASADKPKPRLDHFSDLLPTGALFRIGTNRFQFGSPLLLAIAASADGKLVAAHGPEEIGIWEVATGREVRRIAVDHRVGWALAFTPDAKSLAFSDGMHLSLVDILSGKVRKLADLDRCAAIAVASDGQILTVVEYHAHWSVRRFDVATGKTLKEWRFGPDPRPPGVDDLLSFMPYLSADGTRLAVLQDHGDEPKQTVHFYDATTGIKLRQWPVLEPVVDSLALSGDGKLVAAGSQELATLRVWESATAKELSRWKADILSRELDSELHFAFAPDGASLISYGPGGLTRWDWRTGKRLRHYPDVAGPIAFPADGKTVAVHDTRGAVRNLDVATGADRCPLPRPGSHVAFSPDSRRLAWSDRNAIVLTDAVSGKEVRRWPADVSEDSPLAFSPDGRTLASAGEFHGICLWEVASGRQIRVLEAAVETTGLTTGLFFSPNGRRMVSRHTEEIRLWDVDSGKRLGRWAGEYRFMAINPDFATVAINEPKSSVIRLLDTVTGETKYEWSASSSYIQTRLDFGKYTVNVHYRSDPMFSSDGRLLLAQGEALDAHNKFGVLLWDVTTGKRKPPILQPDTFMLEHLACAPDNRLLALMRADLKICLVSAATGEVVRLLGQAKDRMTSPPIFTRDGRMLITAVGSLVQCWEVATGGEICRRNGGPGKVLESVISADGQRLATVGDDYTVVVWDLARLVTDATPTESLWLDLASRDAVRGRRAIETLVATPATAIPLLRDGLKPVPAPDTKQLSRWIADLGSDDFEQRQRADRELIRAGELAGPALRVALTANLPLEARRRIEKFVRSLEDLPVTADQLPAVRAVQVLEMIGTREARAVLQSLADGAVGARQTEEAKASLERLSKRAVRRL